MKETYLFDKGLADRFVRPIELSDACSFQTVFHSGRLVIAFQRLLPNSAEEGFATLHAPFSTSGGDGDEIVSFWQ